ncbi:MAG: arylesterase [Bacteroidetes bacterium]|nr:MAG: arylesterase [Bacteroidota bacterium]PTM13488.1 MAG: arylesterase [Bacteroidota bacterium]
MNSLKTNFLISIVLLLLLCWSCGQEPQPAAAATSKPAAAATVAVDSTKPARKKARIIFFGDSLTAGYGLDEQYSFPSLIQDKIDSLGLNYEVVNAGLSGETSAGGINRIDWVMEQPVDVFILELGGNDALRGFDLATTRTNLQGILDKVKAKYPTAQLIVAGMEAPPNMGSAYAREFRTIYQKLATDNHAALIPFLLADVGGIPTLNLADRIHPNEQGQVIVAGNVWRVLGEVLK